MWKRQIAAAHATGAQVLAPDLRGFGASPAERGSMDEYADDVVRLLDHRKVDRAVLVGLSMGGYVTLAFARRHPSRVRGLLLADTKATPDTAEGRAARDVNARKVVDEGSAAIFDLMASKLLSTHASKEVVEEMRAIASSQPTRGLADALIAMRDRIDSTPYLSSISVPTCVVVGDEDAITPVSDARHLADSIPAATLEIIERAGHLANVEQPEKFTKTLLSLL